jgi:hypothetical protein
MKIMTLFFALSALITGLVGPVYAEQTLFPSPALQKVRSTPKKYSESADVIVEWVEATDPCDPDQICVEGVLYNQGRKTANSLRLLVEIGGSKYGKPRTSFYRPVDQPSMEPGDRQDFAFPIDRKIPYKDKEEMKEIEVGKFNFKVTPTWAGKDPIVKPKTSRKN